MDDQGFEPQFIRNAAGRICAMHVRVRPGPAVRAIQPNPKYLVYFYLDAEDLPVGLKFLEPVVGVAASWIATKLITGPDGLPKGVDCTPEHGFFSLEEMTSAIHAIGESKKLADCSAG